MAFTDELNELFGIQPPGGPVNIDPLAQDTSDVEAILANILQPPKEENPWAKGLMGFGEALATSPDKLGSALLTGVRGGAQQYYKASKTNESDKRKHAEDMLKTALALKGRNDKYEIASMKLQQQADQADIKNRIAEMRADIYGKSVTGNLDLRRKSLDLARTKADAWISGAAERLRISEENSRLNKGKEIFDREMAIDNTLNDLRKSFGDQTYMDDDAKLAINQTIEETRARLRKMVPEQAVPPIAMDGQATAQPIPQPIPEQSIKVSPNTVTVPKPGTKYRKGQKAQLPDGSIVMFDGTKWVPQ